MEEKKKIVDEVTRLIVNISEILDCLDMETTAENKIVITKYELLKTRITLREIEQMLLK